jgi:RNA polymerase sigma factor (sigma-70 family)
LPSVRGNSLFELGRFAEAQAQFQRVSWCRDGEDVVQEALIEAYRKLDQFDESQPLKAWLFRIAHSRGIDFLRRKGAQGEAEAAAAVRTRSRQLIRTHWGIGKAVEHLVASLPPKQRACVLLKEVFDYSLEEIAELVETTGPGNWPWLKWTVNRWWSFPDGGADTWTSYSVIHVNVTGQKIERIADYIHCP